MGAMASRLLAALAATAGLTKERRAIAFSKAMHEPFI
jgi:hypothetical protein